MECVSNMRDSAHGVRLEIPRFCCIHTQLDLNNFVSSKIADCQKCGIDLRMNGNEFCFEL